MTGERRGALGRAVACIALILFGGLAPAAAQGVSDHERATQAQAEPEAIPPALDRVEQSQSARTYVLRALRESVSPLASPEYRWALESIFNTGVEVAALSYSWQIGLRVRGTTKRCGAILISPSYVLTAAHCVDRKPGGATGGPEPYSTAELEAFAASETFGERPVALHSAWGPVIHHGYRAGGPFRSYDAALLRLAQPLDGATPAPLGRRTFATGDAVASGWGDHPSGSTGVLRAVTVPVVEEIICRDRVPPENWDMLGRWALCTVDDAADSCARDSGGPLVVGSRSEPQTIGIVSWGGQSNCGARREGDLLLGVYTRGSAIADWVLQATGDAATVTERKPGSLMTIRSL